MLRMSIPIFPRYCKNLHFNGYWKRVYKKDRLCTKNTSTIISSQTGYIGQPSRTVLEKHAVLRIEQSLHDSKKITTLCCVKKIKNCYRNLNWKIKIYYLWDKYCYGVTNDICMLHHTHKHHKEGYFIIKIRLKQENVSKGPAKIKCVMLSLILT